MLKREHANQRSMPLIPDAKETSSDVKSLFCAASQHHIRSELGPEKVRMYWRRLSSQLTWIKACAYNALAVFVLTAVERDDHFALLNMVDWRKTCNWLFHLVARDEFVPKIEGAKAMLESGGNIEPGSPQAIWYAHACMFVTCSE